MSTLQVRMRDKRQLTLPVSIARDANIQADDVLNVQYVNGQIIFTLKKPAESRPPISSFVGAAKGAYGSSALESHALLAAERDTWER